MPPFQVRQHAERLVKIDLPALPLTVGQPRELEIVQPGGDTWVRWRTERFTIDGRMKLQCMEKAPKDAESGKT